MKTVEWERSRVVAVRRCQGAMFRACVLILAVVAVTVLPASAADFSDWSHRARITIDGYHGDEVRAR